MTWFGTVSAWGAAVCGAALALVAALNFSAGIVPWLLMLSAALLLTGAFRTLRKMSGGLRLLCGAWGFVAAYLFAEVRSMTFLMVLPDNLPELVVISAAAVLPFVALTGLALTVLHKETK